MSKLIAFLYSAFLLVIVSIMMLVPVSDVLAEETVSNQKCEGQNMMARLKPELLAKMEAEAAAQKNGKGRLWKIEKAGNRPSYIFGTIHLSDPRVLDMTPEAKKAYEAADTVAVETTEVLDEKATMGKLASRPDLTMFMDGTKLSSLVDPNDLAGFTQGMSELGMPLVALEKMKPWLIWGALSIPTCEKLRRKQGAHFLDFAIADGALTAGQNLVGFETMLEQMEAIDSIAAKSSVRNLVDMVKLRNEIDDLNETIIQIYEAGNTAMISSFSKYILTGTGMHDDDYNEFEEKLLKIRNVNMAIRAEKILDEGNAFIAVGAAHLAGDAGLIEKFREAGYTVTLAGN